MGGDCGQACTFAHHHHQPCICAQLFGKHDTTEGCRCWQTIERRVATGVQIGIGIGTGTAIGTGTGIHTRIRSDADTGRARL